MSGHPATGLELVWRYDPAVPDPFVAAGDGGGGAAAARAGEPGVRRRAPAPRGGRGSPARDADRRAGRRPRRGAALPPEHVPFAAVVGCSDARVPLELVLGQQANDVFVVRVAGNVLGRECLGSLEYAVDHLEGLRLLVVLGHTNCGAVRAAVDAYLDPPAYLVGAADPPLRAIIDGLMAPVRAAAQALESVGGSESATRLSATRSSRPR